MLLVLKKSLSQNDDDPTTVAMKMTVVMEMVVMVIVKVIEKSILCPPLASTQPCTPTHSLVCM